MNRLQYWNQEPPRNIAPPAHHGVPLVHTPPLEINPRHFGEQDRGIYYPTNVAHGTSTNSLLAANQMSPSFFATEGAK